MKKFLIIVLIILLFGYCSYIDNNYTRKECVVVDVTETGCLIRDKIGELWYYEYNTNDEHYEVNDKVNLKMHNNFTDSNIEDDVIKQIVKAED